MKKIPLFLVVLFVGFCFQGNAKKIDPSKDWSISVQLWTFHIFTFTQAIEKADSCGLKVIQAFPGQKLGGNLTSSFGPGITPADAKAVKALLKSKGLTINAYGVVGAGSIAEWKSYFEFAKLFSIPIIVAEPTEEQLNGVDSLAGIYHIKIAIHDHPRPSHYWNPEIVIAAMKGHPNIGACADIGHWARNGLNIVDCLKKLEGHIYNVHLKDVTTFDKVDAADTIPGKGVIDMPAVFAELKRQNYKGSFSIEHESNWENNMGDVKEIVAFYNDQVAKLK